MVAIGFLHTSPVHVPTFDALVAEFGRSASAVEFVDESLLERARVGGADDPIVRAGVERAIAELVEQGADVVVCTCSTIGGVAESVGRRRGTEVLRVDRPMAELAVRSGGRIAVVAALASTIGPTLGLLDDVAHASGREVAVAVHVVDGAWELFEAGDRDGYVAAVAAALPEIAETCDVIVLAQASMAATAESSAVDELGVPVLASPRTAVASVLASR